MGAIIMSSLVELLEQSGRIIRGHPNEGFIIEPVTLDHAITTDIDANAISDGWKRTAARYWYHPLHRLSPYIGRFPPALAHYFITKFSVSGDTVFDPFAGSGTVPLEANLLRRQSIGYDIFTYAYVLSHAKARPVEYEAFLTFLARLERECSSRELAYAAWTDFEREPLYEDLRVYFHEETLRSLVSLRAHLLQMNCDGRLNTEEYDLVIFTLAMLCGVLHGPSSMYLSVQTKDTWASSVRYVKNYLELHNIRAAIRNPYDSLRTKAKLVFREGPALMRGVVCQQDSMEPYHLPDESIDLVVTSPPYLAVRDYTNDNWLRVWLLGQSPQQERRQMLITRIIAAYEEKMRQALRHIWRVLREDAVCILVAGDVVRPTKAQEVYCTAHRLAAIGEEIGFRTIACISDENTNINRRTSQLYNTRRYVGMTDGCPRERIIILAKGNCVLHCDQSIAYPLRVEQLS